ncbi:MAG: hypothetical protein ACOVSW_01670, partial [Candidatus Kapaibacteriota bacterium]
MYLVRFENAQGRLASISAPAQISLIVSDSTLAAAGFSSSDRSRLRLYWVAVDTTQQTIEISTRIVGDSVIGTSQLSGAYFAGIAIPLDTISPQIVSTNLVNNSRVQSLPIFWVQVKDVHSGITPVISTILINDVPQNISYRPDLGQFTVEQPTNVRRGQNIVAISIHDRAGNVVQSSLAFTISSTASIQSSFAIRPIAPLQTLVNTPVSNRIILDGIATIFSASSDNSTLIPPANVVVSGTGTERTMTITPAANQIGSAQITLIANNGSQEARQSFTVRVGAAQAAVQTGFRLLTPQNRADNQSQDITFRWGAEPSAFAYQFQLSSDPSFDWRPVSTITQQTFFRVSELNLGQWYYWRVRPANGAWSETFSFRTAPTSRPASGTSTTASSPDAVPPLALSYRLAESAVHGEFVLGTIQMSVMPNPFSHTTTLEYLL